MVLGSLDSMLNQSKLSGFLNSADQATKITGVVEDIRDAVMDYQVCCLPGLVSTSPSCLFTFLPDFFTAGH
jgi:hypothetical protein